MKLILSSLLLLSATIAFAQKKGATMRDLEGLPGNWTGQLTFTVSGGEKNPVILPTKMEILNMTDSLLLNITYTDIDKTVTDKIGLRIFNEGKSLGYLGKEFDIVAVRRIGDRLTIIADGEGIVLAKAADIRLTFIIGPGILNMQKEVKFEGMQKYFTITKLESKKL